MLYLKYSLALALLAAILVYLAYYTNTESNVFAEDVNIGKVIPGALVPFTLTLDNKGSKKIRLLSSKCCCGTSLQLDTTVIGVGARREIKGEVHTPGEPGTFQRPVVLICDSDGLVRIPFYVRGVVEEGVID